MNSNQGFQPPNQGNPSPQPYQPPHKRSLEDIVTQFVQTQQSTNTEFRTALNDVRSQITKLTSSIGNLQQEKGKLPSQPIQNPQGQNSVGSLGSSEGTFEHCKAVTTLRSGKVVDKTIPTKEPSQESQSESVREDEISDKPHVPNTNEFDDQPEEDKSTCGPYPIHGPARLAFKWKEKCEKKMWVDFRVLENPSQRRNGFTLESPLTFIFIFKWGKPSKNKKSQ